MARAVVAARVANCPICHRGSSPRCGDAGLCIMDQGNPLTRRQGQVLACAVHAARRAAPDAAGGAADAYRGAWTPALAAAGLAGVHFHDLRHTGNQLSTEAEVNLRELMARMGHDSTRAALI